MMKNTFSFLTIIFCYLYSISDDYCWLEKSQERKAACLFKLHLNSLSTAEISQKMQMHFLNMGLVNSKNEWASPLLEPDKLIKNNTAENLTEMVDFAVEYSEQTPAFHRFVSDFSNIEFPEFYTKILKEGPVIFPYLASYAMAINNLKKIMEEKPEVSRVVFQILEDNSQVAGAYGGVSLYLKYNMIRLGMSNAMNYYVKGELNAMKLKGLVPLYTLEAPCLHLLQKNHGRDIAWWILSQKFSCTK